MEVKVIQATVISIFLLPHLGFAHFGQGGE